MTREETIGYLVDEVDEFLGAGRVGVYELMEMLNSDDFPQSIAERREIAEAAFRRIVASGKVRLRRGEWASLMSEPADGETPSEADWDTPGEEPYLFMEPAD